MKNFILKCSSFITLFVVSYATIYLYVLPVLIDKSEGPSTENQIINSFKHAKKRDYELLIMGNSGTYRGINPDSLSLKAFNFSHDNDSYNQIYHKLVWLEKNNKQFDYLILGVDYFQFSFLADSRNYVYSSLLGKDYLEDYKNANFFSTFLLKNNFLDFKRIGYLQNMFKKKDLSIFQKENGQYIRPGVAREDDSVFYSINRLPIQKKYFVEILNYCTQKNIEVFLCMLPVRSKALTNYTDAEIVEFNQFIYSHTSDKVHFIDYSHQKGWELSDYTDITHLNENAANRFSKCLNDSILKYVHSSSEIRNKYAKASNY